MNRILSHRLGSHGFTLVELVVVCALVGLMLVLAIPALTGSLDSLRVKNASASLAADIRLAQVQAQKEGKRARLSFSPDMNAYSVEIATSSMASEDCSSTDYRKVKTESLDAAVILKDATVSCIVFESTGRTAWINPKVLQSSTTPPDPLFKPIWSIFMNGVEMPWNQTVYVDPNVNTWTDPVSGTVEVVLDLGGARFVESVSPYMIRDSGDGVDFPESIEVAWSSVTTSVPPGPGGWHTHSTMTKPYPNTTQSPDGVDWYRARPDFSLNLTTRYLRFTFVPSEFDPGYPRVLALEEVKVSDPSVVVSTLNGRKSRKLTIAPITGRVTIQ